MVEEWQNYWSPARRFAASVLVAVHLAAVMSAPWAGPPPAPELAQRVAQLLAPYQVMAFLNHGYRFFAPDPGPSHIVRYELDLADGTTESGRLPDPENHWPRLLYHRYFMMTETLFNTYSQIQDQAPFDLMNDQQRQEVENRNAYARRLLQVLAKGIADQLLKDRDAVSVRLYLQQHDIPFPEDVQDGMKLNDPRLYVDVTNLGQFDRDES